MAILKIKDKGVWKEIQAIKGDTGHDVYVGDKSKAPSEAKLIIEPVKGTATGTDIQVTDSANDRVSKLVLDGKSTQETRSGKNIAKFDQSKNTSINSWIYTSNVANNITATKKDTGDSFYATFVANVVKGEQYVFSTSTSNRIYIYCYSDKLWGTVIKGLSAVALSSAVPLKFTSNYTGQMIIGLYGTTTSVEAKDFQLEKGLTATPYEPYGVSPSPDYPS